MKKLLTKINKKSIKNLISSASFSILTLVLVNIANSTSCYFIHQPKEPSAIDSFKWTK